MERQIVTRLVYTVAAALLVVILFPLPQVVAPDWTVITLDTNHGPLAGVTVREVWQHYSFEDSSHEEDRLSDSKGQVHFPRRTRRGGIAGRFLGCARQVVSTGAEASCGAHSYLVAFGQGVDTMGWEDSGQEEGTSLPWQDSKLVAKH